MEKLKELLLWYENLSEKNLDQFNVFYDEESFFKDPFNEVVGRKKIEKIFKDMFIHLEGPRFVIVDVVEQGSQAFLTWNLFFVVKKKRYQIHGSSHLKFNDSQKVFYHRDYWDVGEELLLKLPLIKRLYGALRKKLSSS